MATAPAAPLRIVCFFAVVFCGGGARAAPTVAYDQRQNGEFNLRVDLDDVAVVLLAGGADGAELFPLRRDVQRPGEKAHIADNVRVLQLLRLAERRNGSAARPKKKNKKPIDCAAATTAAAAAVVSEKPYAETAGAGHRPQSPSSAAGPTSPAVPVVPVDYETPQGLPSSPADDRDEPSPVSESGVPVVAANGDPQPHSGPDEYLIDDPYSVTPGTPDFSERNSLSSSADDHMVAVKTVENHPAPVRVDEFPENAVAAVKPAESPPPVLTRFEEKPISVSSDAKVVGEKSDAATVAAPRDEAEVKAKIPADGTPASPPPPPQQEPVTADGAAIVTKTVETPNDSAAGTAEKSVTDENPLAAAPAATNSLLTAEKKPEVPVELVAVKTVEKPTFAEALKADGKPSITAAESAKPAEEPAEKSSASAAPVDVRVRANEKTIAAETVVVAEAPTEVAKKSADAVAATGITTSTRPVELVKDKSAAAVEAVVVVSRLAAKPTAEMVAVKTIENAGTTVATTGNTAVKTVVKSGNAKTTLHLTNGSSIVRKVADRRPLPSATFEVAAPNVARA